MSPLRPARLISTVLVFATALVFGATAEAAESLPANTPLARLAPLWPASPADCTSDRAERFDAVCRDVENWAGDAVWGPAAKTSPPLNSVKLLVAARLAVDPNLTTALELRSGFPKLSPDAAQKAAARAFLQIASRAVELSGRLRYLLRDAIDHAAAAGDSDPKLRSDLIAYLIKEQVGIGGGALGYLLFDPPTGSEIKPADLAAKRGVLQLMALSGEQAMLEELSELVSAEAKTSDELVVHVAATIRQIGLPQAPPPGSPPDSRPQVTPQSLDAALRRTVEEKLPAELQPQRRELLAWLAKQIKEGETGETFRVANMELREGDWFLMRNPSPYNRFTDLSPGLFTHVGVVTTVKGSDGIRRFVIVDLPERGEAIPAMNVDDYLSRTLHYVFLRHRDPAACQKMSQVAASIIGNPTQFDLTFRTERVLQYKGQPLAGKTINTYCAGLLLLVAQETGRPSIEFFPLRERPAGGNLPANLKQLGLSMGDDFLSPTGALFSPQMQIVGRREPMYEPGREIAEAIFDAFASDMIGKSLTPSPDAAQLARQSLAELSKTRPWLAARLARANGVSDKLDLESAAKAGAVIESLDQIVDENRQFFEQAREAMLAPPPEKLAAEGFKPEEIERIAQARKRHPELYARFATGGITPREVRLLLVKHYTAQGIAQMEARFFR